MHRSLQMHSKELCRATWVSHQNLFAFIRIAAWLQLESVERAAGTNSGAAADRGRPESLDPVAASVATYVLYDGAGDGMSVGATGR